MQAHHIRVEEFEGRVYCNVEIGTFALSCRKQADGTAICCMWKQRSDGPPTPSHVLRRQAEAIAEAEFVKATLVRVA